MAAKPLLNYCLRFKLQFFGFRNTFRSLSKAKNGVVCVYSKERKQSSKKNKIQQTYEERNITCF